MAVPHAQPMDIVDVRPLGTSIHDSRSVTLVKTDCLEVIRLVLPAGKNLREHNVDGEIMVQCLDGRVELKSGDKTCDLTAGQLVYLAAAARHSLRAADDSSLLLTILLQKR